MKKTSPEKDGQFIMQYARKSSTKVRKNVKSNARDSSNDDEDLSRYTLKTASKHQSKLRKEGKTLRVNKDRNWICY